MNKLKHLAKRYNSHTDSWIGFGAPNKKDYDKWSPRVCGICCVKMIGDAYGCTNKASIYRLTMECKQKGGFKELSSGEIQGVFHNSLLKLSKSYGLTGSVEKKLSIEKITSSLRDNKFVILSIDKSKIKRNLEGGHLILLHAYDPKRKFFLVNDPDPILARRGENILIKIDYLQKISNNKGLIIWPKNKIKK